MIGINLPKRDRMIVRYYDHYYNFNNIDLNTKIQFIFLYILKFHKRLYNFIMDNHISRKSLIFSKISRNF